MKTEDLKLGDTVLYKTHGGSLTGEVIAHPLSFPWKGCASVRTNAHEGIWVEASPIGECNQILIRHLELVNKPEKVETSNIHYCITCGYTEVAIKEDACKWCTG